MNLSVFVQETKAGTILNVSVFVQETKAGTILNLYVFVQETLLSVQKLYQRMMSENLMKPGRTGILEEMARNRDSMLNQVNKFL